VASEHDDLAASFDAWYDAMTDAPAKDAIVQRHLGLPPDLLSTSTLSWQGIEQVAAELSLDATELLVDLACGRGGYGLELASRTGARLIGIDIAPAAIRAARELASRRGIECDFRVGDLVASGLPDGVADAVMVVDAIQFPTRPSGAYEEIFRILRPGGRVVLTCWEPLDREDAALPAILRDVDLSRGLSEAGFVDVDVQEHDEWRVAERAMWTDAAELEPGDDEALASLHEEAVRALPVLDHVRRVLGVGRRPAAMADDRG
jgi:SAM-dependent methyltransferase